MDFSILGVLEPIPCGSWGTPLLLIDCVLLLWFHTKPVDKKSEWEGWKPGCRTPSPRREVPVHRAWIWCNSPKWGRDKLGGRAWIPLGIWQPAECSTMVTFPYKSRHPFSGLKVPISICQVSHQKIFYSFETQELWIVHIGSCGLSWLWTPSCPGCLFTLTRSTGVFSFPTLSTTETVTGAYNSAFPSSFPHLQGMLSLLRLPSE